MTGVINIVGGGLAGCEAAWQALMAGCSVRLYEMRPQRQTAAHKTGDLAELVCSNSLKSTKEGTAPSLLKQEMACFNSLIVQAAFKNSVPAGQALAVDRRLFSQFIFEQLHSYDRFKLCSEEISQLPSVSEIEESQDLWIIASGPLTSENLFESLSHLCGREELYFYDAIAPVVEADSINPEVIFRANRWQKPGDGDYLNIPLSKDQYIQFVKDICDAEKVPLHSFEKAKYFESCLPIEVMAERGVDTLRYGPMKPIGLVDPRTGRRPYAAVQLRMEDRHGAMFSMVGFQTKMKWPEQTRIFRSLPGMAEAEFFKLGSVHRNTYLNSPKLLNADLSLKASPRIFLAGQISGVEGYTESAAMGLLAGRAASSKMMGSRFLMPPHNTIMGGLYHHIVDGGCGDFQPMNANLGLLKPIPKQRGVSKESRKLRQYKSASSVFEEYMQNM